MSDKALGRRTAIRVAFEGVDISDDIAPYLISLQYTDAEDAETDDLQIKLHDREGVWALSWLNDMTEAAARPSVRSDVELPKVYIVTPQKGAKCRVEPKAKAKESGSVSNGERITAAKEENGFVGFERGSRIVWVQKTYLRDVSDDTVFESKNTGLEIEAMIVRENFAGDGEDTVLDCGIFELDSVKASGPPATISIKATSLPYNAQIRQTKKSKAWEAYTLSGIAYEMARENGMACMYLAPGDPYYDRREQYDESDMAFLMRLCSDAGLSLKATAKMIVIYDQREYEAKKSAFEIARGDGSYEKYDLSISTADTQYQSCRVSYVKPDGTCVEAVVYVEDYKEDKEGEVEEKRNQQLEVTAKVETSAEARELAKMRLRMHNKYSRTVSFTMAGDPALSAGLTFEVKDWGAWTGKYIISRAVHTVNGSGYVTKIDGRKVLEGY